MKNSTIIFLFVVLFLYVGLVACGSDIPTEKIIGTWEQELVSIPSGKKSTSTTTVTFTENGEMIRINIGKNGSKLTAHMKYELFKKDGKLVLGYQISKNRSPKEGTLEVVEFIEDGRKIRSHAFGAPGWVWVYKKINSKAISDP